MTPEANISVSPQSREYHPWRYLPGQIVLHLPGVRLVERRDGNGKKSLVDNTDSPEVLEQLAIIDANPQHEEHQKMQALKDQLDGHHKVAKFVVGAGVIIVTLASIGYEVFVREAKDVKSLLEKVEDHKRR